MAHTPRRQSIKFGLDPAPAPLQGEHHVDNLQDLIQKRREIAKNKSKFHLSEADCNLLLTNAREFHYKDKQVIVQEGQELPSMYRIKAGKVNITKGGVPVSVIAQGWFLGETIFLNGRTCVYDASLVACGAVTIAELNIPFVKRLFEVDHTLAFKFYRTLAAKLSSVHYAILGHLLGTYLEGINCGPSLLADTSFPLSGLHSSSSSSTVSSTSSSSSSSPPPSSPASPNLSSRPLVSSASETNLAANIEKPTRSASFSYSSAPTFPPSPASSSSSSSKQPNAPISQIPNVLNPYAPIVSNAAALSKCPNLPDSFLLEVINRKKTRQISKRRSVSSLHAAFKTYNLESNGKGLQKCRLKLMKMNLMSEAFGFKHKNSIEYNKIKNIVRTSEKSVTVIYEPFLAKTLFFRTPEDAEEFYGLATSLVEAVTTETKKPTTGVPISAAPALAISDHPEPNPDHDEELKSLIQGLATRMDMRKGEYLLEEGDLYQRIYTIISGEVHAVSNGVKFGAMGAGEVVGLPSLLHLRPCPASLVIASETATILMLPAYKIIDMSKDNLPLAARLYKRAATTLQHQIEGIMRKTRNMAENSNGSGEVAQASPAQPPRGDSFSSSPTSSPSSSPNASPASSPAASPTPVKASSSALLSAQ